MNVLNEQCATCIFRPGNLMHLRPGRVKQMVAECQRRDTFIPCHEHMSHVGEDDEVVTADSPVCRGFYDRYPGVGQLLRIMGRLGNLWFVDGSGNRLERAS